MLRPVRITFRPVTLKRPRTKETRRQLLFHGLLQQLAISSCQSSLPYPQHRYSSFVFPCLYTFPATLSVILPMKSVSLPALDLLGIKRSREGHATVHRRSPPHAAMHHSAAAGKRFKGHACLVKSGSLPRPGIALSIANEDLLAHNGAVFTMKPQQGSTIVDSSNT